MSSSIPALIGFSINEFTFIGFLPHKKGKEKKIKTIIIYESPILNTLYIIKNYIGNIEKQTIIGNEFVIILQGKTRQRH